YLKEIRSDPEAFAVCTDTIVRQVKEIGRMIDEFSAFARMPAPVMKTENLAEICEQSLSLRRDARPEIEFRTDFPGDAVEIVDVGSGLSVEVRPVSGSQGSELGTETRS
ncbi:MAG: hypothetical protein IH849_09625, partial [Acidobacteria bacterium]|nr:hypothetical protein [Acidobacteriota bacterium]